MSCRYLIAHPHSRATIPTRTKLGSVMKTFSILMTFGSVLELIHHNTNRRDTQSTEEE